MLGADPPRRPPQRNPLTRSKSCHGPTRRKRGREVLEDITWIVNHPSSWQNDTSTGQAAFNSERDDGSLRVHLEELDEAAQRLPLAGPSNASPLLQPASTPVTRAVNMARARSDTSLPSINTHDAYLNSVRSERHQLNGLLAAPRASTSRITNLDSSSPPSSPHSSSRYGFVGGTGSSGSSSSTRGLGLSRAATLPFLTPGSSSGLAISRPPARAPSPSLRAPPPLRRSNSSSSISSMNGDPTRSSSPSTLNTPSTSPMQLSSAFSVDNDTGTTRALSRARTMPTYTAQGMDVAAQGETAQEISRVLPIPTIQREMPSPERKRSRRGGRVIFDNETEDVVDPSSDEE